MFEIEPNVGWSWAFNEDLGMSPALLPCGATGTSAGFTVVNGCVRDFC